MLNNPMILRKAKEHQGEAPGTRGREWGKEIFIRFPLPEKLVDLELKLYIPYKELEQAYLGI
jgi:hypothetical protein